jgi:hypothetical protein
MSWPEWWRQSGVTSRSRQLQAGASSDFWHMPSRQTEQHRACFGIGGANCLIGRMTKLYSCRARAFVSHKVIGAKSRADSAQGYIVPQLDDKKWRNSVPLVPIASVCCTCVPGLLPLLPHKAISY